MENKLQYSESELVLLLTQQNEAAFSYLYDNYSGALFASILSIVNNQEAAADTLQEVFIKIFRQIQSYDSSKGRLYTWMLNIARNAAIDTTRSKGFQKTQQNQELSENVYDLSGSAEIKTDDIGLKKLVHSLRPEWKVLVELAYFEGYTQDEISKMLNIPLGTIKTRLRAALKELHKLIKE
ncbi:RNA polymerase sigma factor [Sediminibacterium sp.]|uniref:RNA polymerase sigma factor n=1 Tax=Sediminibacterium sp. TaxID=1917865 RepID=UPI003F7234B2